MWPIPNENIKLALPWRKRQYIAHKYVDVIRNDVTNHNRKIFINATSGKLHDKATSYS